MKYLKKYSKNFEKFKKIKNELAPKKIEKRFKAKATCSKKYYKSIENRPIIYDTKHPDYGDKDLTDKAWADIASELNSTGMFFLKHLL